MAESKDNTKFEELCAGYVLNSLEHDENKEFLGMLENATDKQQQFYQDMEAISAEMAILYPEVEPSSDIRQQLIDMAWTSVNKTSGSNIHYLTRFRYAVAASLIFMVAALGLMFNSLNLKENLTKQGELLSKQGELLQEQNETINQYQNQLVALQSDVQRKEELLTILEARDVDLVLMDGLDVNPGGYGKVVWDKDNGQALLQVANLPSVPTDKDYQLWFIINNQPVSAGVFAVNNPTEDNFFKIEQLFGQATSGAFAITMEPKGGVPQPSGDMYLLGNMN